MSHGYSWYVTEIWYKQSKNYAPPAQYREAEITQHASVATEYSTYLSIYLSLFVQQKDNLNAIEHGHAVGQDSETKSTEHFPKYKQSTVIQIPENRPRIKNKPTL